MRFGMFFELQMPKPWAANAESQTFWEAIEQVTFAEEMGFEQVWLVEHHFLAEFAHSSAPEVTLAIMADRTSKMRLGFGVVLTPVHHPLHVAARVATLDIFSNGRVDVGVGRTKGPYQLNPFGTDASQSHSMMLETLECLPGMWTQEVFSHEGKHWTIPPREVIPKPVQKPHPPLARACLSDDSIISMGRIARPVLFRGRSVEAVGRSIRLYRETMLSSGFDEKTVENALDNSWFWFEAHLAETDDDALDGFLTASGRAGRHVAEMRERWNPKDQEVNIARPPLPRSAYGSTPNISANENLIGSPERVAEHVRLLGEVGVRNLMLTNRGLMSKEKTATSLRLLSEKVMPQFR